MKFNCFKLLFYVTIIKRWKWVIAMFEDAIKAATKLLNDKSLKIVEYAETDDYYLFNYVNSDNSIELIIPW